MNHSFTRRTAILSVTAFVLALSVVAEGILLNNASSGSGQATEQTAVVQSLSPEPEAPTPTLTPSSSPTIQPTATFTPTPNSMFPGDFKNVFTRQPLAVMVDNIVFARPQSGLSDADVVYEAVVEAGITRFMAIFGNHDSEVVGPVRSGRHYFMYWANEYNAVYVMAGASPQGYSVAQEIGLPRIDYTYGEGYFWRAADRDAPHNLYTDIARLRTLIPDSKEGRLGSLEFKPDRPNPTVNTITLTHPDGYRVGYIYQEGDNSYSRYMQREPHVDAYTGVQYHPKNVIVQFVPTWRIRGDTAGRMDMELVGSGLAYFFLDGIAVKGTWRKDSPYSPTLFLNEQGAPVRFNAGQTWIQVAPADSTLEFE
jgi:hypothetical protein